MKLAVRVCISYFPGCSDKILARSNLEEERSIWLTVSVVVASSWQGACGHGFSHFDGLGLDMWLHVVRRLLVSS